MRLLHVDTLKLTDFSAEPPEYVILSHCWRHGPNEILYEDVEFSKPRAWQEKKEQAAEKVLSACDVTRLLGLKYIWIDTCCIDKRSSAELSEAINSMYLWYRQARVCVAFLDDVDGPDDLRSSRWFTRGWTLQELIAPDNVWFYNKCWSYIGDKISMAEELSVITGIDEAILSYGHEPNSVRWADQKGPGERPRCVCGSYFCLHHYGDRLRNVLSKFSVATKMSWAARRKTTREEDMAYCLMGLFDINMPLLYGEKGKAFRRLQEEIIRRTNDQSILIWLSQEWLVDDIDLASSPALFLPLDIKKRWSLDDANCDNVPTPQMSISNQGLEVDLLLFPTWGPQSDKYWAFPNCTIGDDPLARPGILLNKSLGSHNTFQRCLDSELLILTPERPLPQDGSVYKGVGKRVSKTTGNTGISIQPASEQDYVDLSAGEVRRITIQRTWEARATHLPNRYALPPLQIGKITDCDGGEYVVQCLLPDFDDFDVVHRVAPPCNEKYGLVLLTQQGPRRFLVAWGVVKRTMTHRTKEIWCKILPAYGVSGNILDMRQRREGHRAMAVELGLYLLSNNKLEDATQVDRAVLDFGEFRREVLAEVKSHRFMGNPFIELTIGVNLAPHEEGIPRFAIGSGRYA